MTRTLPSTRSLAMHEAYHAAGLCMAGMVPECVRTDWPDETTLGAVTVDWGDRPVREAGRAVLVAILLGPMSDGLVGWDWPLDPDRVAALARQDAAHAASLAEYLDLDEVDWSGVVAEARALARRQDFRRLVVAIADELELVEVLDTDDLHRLTEEAWTT